MSVRIQGEAVQSVPIDSWQSYTTATVVAVGLVASLVLFILAVMGRPRTGAGQVQGLLYTVATLPLFIFTYSDRLPLDGLTASLRTSRPFTSSFTALILMAVVYLIRTGVYLQLFLLPAIRLSEKEYYSQDRIEARANDYSAPLFAFVNLDLVAAAALAGLSSLPFWVGVAMFVGIFAIYTFFAFLADLRVPFIWMVVQVTILARALATYVSSGLTYIVIIAAKFERWRRRGSRDLDEFIIRMEQKLAKSRRDARTADEKDRERLRAAVD